MTCLREQPREPEDVWEESGSLRESWRDPGERALREFAEENYAEFIDFIIGYDQSLLFDFAMENRVDFRDFLGD